MKAWISSAVRRHGISRAVLAALALTASRPAPAGTLAYWRFEGDGSITPTNGVFLRDTNGRTTVTTAGILAIDSSGNGNSVFTWDDNATGHQYTNNVASSYVPLTGAANTFSIYNNGSFPASMTWSKMSLPSSDMETLVLTNWTIEASILHTSYGAFSTFIGRDGNGVATNTGGFAKDQNGTVTSTSPDGNLAPLYFQTRNGRVWILFTDASGRNYALADSTGTLTLNSWNHVAAVSDGTTLRLYRNSGSGFVLAGSLTLASGGNTALTYDFAGSSTLGDTNWGWTIGRGRYGSSDSQFDNHTDRFFGRIDEVRISNNALKPSQFLFASTNVYVVSGPTPATNTVPLGAPASFSIIPGGLNAVPQWRHNGTNIPNATNDTYSIASTVAGDAGNYDVVITNNFGSSFTSSVAVLQFHTPSNLQWGGQTNVWDTISLAWTTNNGATYIPYIETDNVRFDQFGVAQNNVTFAGTRTPGAIVVSNAAYTLSGGAISGSASLTVTGNGSLALNTTNSYTGDTIIESGTLTAGLAELIPGNITVGAGGTWEMSGFSDSVNALSGSGTINNNTPTAITLSVGNNNASINWSGTIQHTGTGGIQLVKPGTNTMVWGGAAWLDNGAASQLNGGVNTITNAFISLATAEFWTMQGAGSATTIVANSTLVCSNNWLVIGRADPNARGTMIVNSGTVQKAGNGNIVVGSLGASGTLIVNGGQVLNNAMLWLGEGPSGRGTLFLNGGTLQAAQIRPNNFGGLPTNANASVAYFDGGALQATANNSDLIQITIPYIRDGGLVLDDNGFNVGLTQPLLQDNSQPGGGLTKTGSGSLTLTGTNTYTGATIVNAGTLNLNGSVLSGAAIVQAGGVLSGAGTINGSLSLNSGNARISLSNGVIDTLTVTNGLTLNNGNTLDFEIGFGSADRIALTGGSVSGSGIVTVNLSAAGGFSVGAYNLITGGGLVSTNGLVLGSTPGGGFSYQLATSGGNLQVVVSSSLGGAFWQGDVDAFWNTLLGGTNSNWSADLAGTSDFGTLPTNVTAVTFSALNAGNFNTTLGTDFEISSLAFNTASNVTISGANTLTLGNGITIGPGAGTVTFNVNTLALGFSQVWSNSSSNPLLVNSVVAGGNSVTIAGSGRTTLFANNSYTGGTFINGGTLQLGAANVLADTGPLTVNGGVLDIGANNDTVAAVTLNSGTITGTSGFLGGSSFTVSSGNIAAGLAGSGALTKIGAATTVSVTSSNINTGATVVSAGTLTLSGSIANTGNNVVGNTAGIAGVLNLAGGSFNADNVAANQFTSTLLVGSGPNSVGVLRMSSGKLSVQRQLGLGNGTGAYGAWSMSGGTADLGSFLVVGFNNDRAVFNQSGGTVNITNNLMTVAAGGALSIGNVNLSGGTFNSMATAGFGPTIGGVFIGEFGSGVLNVSGSADVNLTGWGLRIGHNGGAAGIANLNGGTVSTVSASGGSGNSTLNLNGGVLKSRGDHPAFMAALSAARVYGGGAVLDDGGFNVTILQSLLAPTGYGVSSIPLVSGGSNYVDRPVVVISGGSGNGATAIANVSGGAVTGFTVTCPGSGYGPSDTLTVTLLGGGGSGASAGTPVLAPNVSGGLTKQGAGTLTLSGANTYTGVTTVAQGILNISSAQTHTGAVVVASGAALRVTVSGSSQYAPARITLNGGALQFDAVNSTNIPPAVTGTLTLNGTNTIKVVGGSLTAGQSYPLITYTTLSGSGTYNTSLPGGVVGSITTIGNTIYLNVTAIGAQIWKGNVNTSWDIEATTNWTVNALPSIYGDGGAVQFDDTATSFTVNLLSNVTPTGVLISNATTYSFGGAGAIGGAGSLTKNGSGLVTMGNTNTYTGDTLIGAGTFRLAGDNVIPGGTGRGDLTVNGTLDLFGHSNLVNGVSGNGTIDTTAGGAAVLVVGASGASGVLSGVVQNTVGTLALVKTGAGALTLFGANSHAGGTTLSAGQLNLNHNTALGAGAGTFTIGGGSVIDVTVSNSVTVTNNNPQVWNGDFTYAGSVTNLNLGNGPVNKPGNAQVTVNANTLTVEGVIGGSGSLNKAGAGTLVLAADNTFSGNLGIGQGTVVVRTIGDTFVPGGVGAGLAITFGSTAGNGTLRYVGTGEETFKQIGLTSTGGSGAIDMSGSGLLKFSADWTVSGAAAHLFTLTGDGPGTGEVAGVISDNNSVNLTSISKSGNGVWILSGPNTFQGDVSIANGSLVVSSIGNPGDTGVNLGGGTNINFGSTNNTGRLVYIGGGETSAKIINLAAGFGTGGAILDQSGSGLLKFSRVSATGATNHTLTLQGSTGGTGEIAGPIPDNSPANKTSLTKAGTGLWTLSGTNTYSGATLINGGTLAMAGDGSITNSATITVASGATLDVSGHAGGGMTIAAGQTVGGNGTVVGNLTVANGATLSPGSSVGTLTVNGNLVLNNSTTLAYELGGSSDRTIVNGNLTLDGVLNVSNAGGFGAGNYTLFTYSGTLTDNGLVIGTVPGGFNYAVVAGGGTVVLQVTSAADPYTTWANNYGLSGGNALGTADPDGDGLSNTNEFLAGFNPTNSAAYLRVISLTRTGNDMVVTYLGANGDVNGSPGPKTNVLEFTTGTGSGGYTNNFVSTGQTNILTGGTGLGVVTNMVDVGGATNVPSRYYRVRVLTP